ncbi:ATP-grasp domain-containing protein [Kitasatospora sp. NRRL B-11411]|uniref:ATP-grasp domain-containing protein n=1 Tax=Kitasatospora sp. NRRL B-11411 TaxID=1463822 RepID=UPI0006924313|nr:ATP-grasp domain-containing protein [Kitasatospora sp. NRRL B-11411]
MHVVLIGARSEAIEALLADGHTVSLLYEGGEHRRVDPYRDRLAHACAVDSYLVVESLWSALHHVGALGPAGPDGDGDGDGADGAVDAVVSVQEHGMVPAALLGRLLGARAIDPQVALRCRDKALQKAAWRAAGIPTADWAVVPDAGRGSVARAAAAAGVAAPYVVKPTAGAATIGVAAADGPAELDALAAELVAQSETRRRLLVEHRVPGEEWHLDGLVRDGALAALLVSRYLVPLIETKRGHPAATVSLLPADHPALYREAAELTGRALAALGHRDGVFHFEVFGGPGEFTAGELAARPGGHMIGALAERVLGIDLWAAAVRAVTGDRPGRSGGPAGQGDPGGSGGRVVGFTDIPTLAGAVNRLGREHVERIPGVVDVEIKIKPGEVMPAMDANSGIRIGTALVEAATEQDCRDALLRIADLAAELNSAAGPDSAPELDSEPAGEQPPPQPRTSPDDKEE